MADKKKSKQESQYTSQDADFGVFRPVRDHATHVPVYATWTQFSGIPPPARDPNVFGWDNFVTPPSPQSVGVETTLHCPNLFSNLNVMNVMGKNSPNDIDSNSHESDKLAATPVAQSLLKALNSNPFSNPLTDSGVPLQAPLNFDIASQDGYDMYAEALKKLGAPWESYSPFGTSDIMNSNSLLQPHIDVGNGVASSSAFKPSYSEVAKTLKNHQNLPKDKEESNRKRSLDMITSKSFKGNKKFMPRPIRISSDSIPNDMRSVSPDSKYGLDDFGGVIIGGCSEKDDKDNSCGIDSTPSLTHKNSTSSLRSGTSGIEEIHLTKTCNGCQNNTSKEPITTEKISNKDKEKAIGEGVQYASKKNKTFFDAKRIFQTKDTNTHYSQSKMEEDNGPMILNNGKPSYTAWHPMTTHNTWCPTAAHEKSTHYINNNLRDSQKKTNQNPVSGTKCQDVPPENVYPENVYPEITNVRLDKSIRARSLSSKDKQLTVKPDMPLQTSFDQELIDEWLTFLWDKAKLCMHQLWTLVLMMVLLVFSIIVYLVSGCVHICSWLWGKLWTFLETNVFKGSIFAEHRWGKTSTTETPKKLGLDENIILPGTGEEAMQRLLACKGKDPYSILGLKSSASDEDIRKYYRRQAVLVHPDKNQQPGAEEAFKILGHAFDLIGDASKRLTYDRQLQEAKEADAAMREFNDLLTKLQEKIQQASNMMRCDNCGGKHKRVPVERPWYSARYCDRCSIRHSAKEGDVWAETTMLGFLWHYYACMEGNVFDITEWVACKKNFFQHMQANAHHVFYRIATEGNRGHHGRSNGSQSAGTAAGGEPDLQDFISNLFHHAVNTDGPTGSHPWQHTTSSTWNQASGESSSHTSTQGKRNRRKKKKH